MRQKRRVREIIQKISVENREQLFSEIRHGKNEKGGVFGGAAPHREPSPQVIAKESAMMLT
jgi:hypothetical protein